MNEGTEHAMSLITKTQLRCGLEASRFPLQPSHVVRKFTVEERELLMIFTPYYSSKMLQLSSDELTLQAFSVITMITLPKEQINNEEQIRERQTSNNIKIIQENVRLLDYPSDMM